MGQAAEGAVRGSAFHLFRLVFLRLATFDLNIHPHPSIISPIRAVILFPHALSVSQSSGGMARTALRLRFGSRSAACCVQLRSESGVQLRSAFSCVLRSAFCVLCSGSRVLCSAAFAFTCVLCSGCCVRVRLCSRSAAFCVRLRSANIARRTATGAPGGLWRTGASPGGLWRVDGWACCNEQTWACQKVRGLLATPREGRNTSVGETMSRRSVCGLPWRTLVRRLADLADYVRSAGGLGGLGQVGLADLADSYWPTWRTWRTRKADLADLADWVGGLGGLGAMMAEDSRTQKTGEDEDSWEQRLQLRSRSTAFCVRDPTFCVQIPAFCVQLRSRSAGFRILRSAVFCVQLRSAFRILRSAFS
eukprot:gene12140-biopygen6439